MRAEDFRAWMLRMGGGKRRVKDAEAAELLGISRNTVAKYRTGEWEVRKTVRLACAAVAFDLPEWRKAA